MIVKVKIEKSGEEYKIDTNLADNSFADAFVAELEAGLRNNEVPEQILHFDLAERDGNVYYYES